MDGIDVELDLLSRHPDRMMQILDMKVHVKFIINEHYEKPVSTRQVISERSAHSAKCKWSVPVSELVRRMDNTSRRLNCPGGQRGKKAIEQTQWLQEEGEQSRKEEAELGVTQLQS